MADIEPSASHAKKSGQSRREWYIVSERPRTSLTAGRLLDQVLLMRRKVIITTPYPTVEEVAAELGVSMKRMRELELLMERLEVDPIFETAIGPPF